MADSAVSLTGTLPTPRTRLIGRENERTLARTSLLHEAVPLLSLLGPGGVGKTRLALAIAGDVEEAFADSVVWVDLAPLTDPDQVPGALAAALDILPSPNEPVMTALVRHLRARQILLLLDNCEHVVAVAAELVAGLLAACPALQVLATSRAPLRIRSEHLILVDPLPLPPADTVSLERLEHNEAIQLFVERARGVRPTFALTAANVPSVAALCRLLDGLPLATELAASRIKILSPQLLLAQMTDRLRLLHAGALDLPARQQTIETTIAWSYDLLEPDEQELFRSLAVFVGGCELEAVVAVAGGDPYRVLHGLEALCNQSLLRTEENATGECRYTMLETIREFALARLEESGDAATRRDAHAAHYLALAEEADVHLRGSEQVIWMRLLEAEYANLRTALGCLRERGAAEQALRLAASLNLFWLFRNDFKEGRRRLEEALSVPGAARTAAWARAQTALGYMTLVVDIDSTAARMLLEETLTVWQELGDRHGIAMALKELAAAVYDSDPVRAQALAEMANATFRELKDDHGVMMTLWDLGVYSLQSGDHSRARAELEEGLSMADARGLTFPRAMLRPLGWLSLAEGDEQRAADLWEERLAADRERGDESATASILDDLGWLALRQRDPTRAVNYFAEELALGAKLGDEWHRARGLAGLAAASMDAGDASRAAWMFGAADRAGITDFLDNFAPHAIGEPYSRRIAATREAIGFAAFDKGWQNGKVLAPQQAVAQALAEVAALSEAPRRGLMSVPVGYSRLTSREAEVLRLLMRRLTDKEIAESLFISIRTAHHHVARICDKLEVNNRRDAAAVAVRLGFV